MTITENLEMVRMVDENGYPFDPELWAEEEILRWAGMEEGDVVDCFDGCEECETWTVGEDRCECGNVRVGWEHDYDGDGKIYWYPVAV